MIKRLKTTLLVAITIMMAIPCAAQSDGGGKKKKTVKTEQTQSSSRNQQQSQNNKKKVQSSVKVSEPDGYINGHGYVDLGLPSGTKWATCNVGATKASDFGGYYAWGEVASKNDYDFDTYFDLYSEDGLNWNSKKYKSNGISIIDPLSGNDTAREIWGGSWRLPSKEEAVELIENCIWKRKVVNEHVGYVVIGPNKHSIFVPSAGYHFYESPNNMGLSGGFWTNSLSTDDDIHACELLFVTMRDRSADIRLSYPYRYGGINVRPVSTK